MPNFEGMDAAMATAISAILLVVFFGYLLAVARLTRWGADDKWTRFAVWQAVGSFTLVIVGFALAQLQLLSVMQEGSVSGGDAIATWVTCLVQFVIPVAATVFIEITTPSSA